MRSPYGLHWVVGLGVPSSGTSYKPLKGQKKALGYCVM